MKRFIILLGTLCVAGFTAAAQDSYYAEMLSRNNYYGTARSIALGGAMTALGGDLGSVTFNPAGSAVNDYCQFTISPGLLFSTTGASYDPTGKESFGDPLKTSHTKFNLPNIGLNLVFFPSEESWITSTSLGIIANTTNTFLNYSMGRGVNSSTSFTAGLARAAGGLGYDDFGRDLAAAYDGNQFGEYGPVGSYKYVGSAERLRPDEAWSYVPGALDQTSIYNTYGTKTDLVFNLGFNVQDRFFFGMNIGIPNVRYRREEVFFESAQNPELHPVIFYDKNDNLVTTNFLSSTNSYQLNTDATGINARFGFIALIGESLRLGGAIQTPSRLAITESWLYKASSSYEDSNFDSTGKSTVGEYSYNLRTPYVVDAGLAYTLPGLGLLSIDYELTDYSVMKYSDRQDGRNNIFYEDAWSTQNYINKTFCGLSHSVRAGVEFKPVDFLSLRAGYSFVSDPEKYWLDEGGNRVTAENWKGYNQILTSSHYFDSVTHAVSFGLGYSSGGSFFADVALRLTSYPRAYYSPYYYGSYEALDKDGKPLDVLAPVEVLTHSVFDAVATLGWRF